jgi:hypothetical protein
MKLISSYFKEKQFNYLMLKLFFCSSKFIDSYMITFLEITSIKIIFLDNCQKKASNKTKNERKYLKNL